MEIQMIGIIAVIIFILDRLTKHWATSTLMGTSGIVIIKDFFDFSYLENTGAAFGILEGKLIFLTIIPLIVIGYLGYKYYKTKNKNMLLRTSAGMLVAGALGNLYDRFFYGYVVDFISVHYKNVYYFPTFNVADISITIGTFLMIIYVLKYVED